MREMNRYSLTLLSTFLLALVLLLLFISLKDSGNDAEDANDMNTETAYVLPYGPLSLDNVAHKSDEKIQDWHDQVLLAKMDLYSDLPHAAEELDSLHQEAHRRFPSLDKH